MGELSYDAAPVAVRGDLAGSHARAWRRIARPGTWLGGAARVAIAAETRKASGCTLCRQRQDALSPYTVAGEHESVSGLPAPMVELIHRVVTDSGRLKQSWQRGLIATGLSEEEYVEAVGVMCTTVAIDTFTHTLGMAPHPLPEPVAGEPARERPPQARDGAAWVPWIAPEDAAGFEDEPFGPGRANVQRALSLVPEECRGFFDVVENQYITRDEMRDFDTAHRAIDRQQMELIAGRVSALNQCVY